MEYDTESGRVLSKVNKNWKDWDDPELSKGCVWKQNGKAFALYGEESDRIFQSGKNKWGVRECVSTVLVNFLLLRNFKIIRNGKTEFNIWYIPKGILTSFIDPTYDMLEAESDDFFLLIHNTFKWEAENA